MNCVFRAVAEELLEDEFEELNRKPASVLSDESISSRVVSQRSQEWETFYFCALMMKT